MSVRNYAILWPEARRTATTASGGNQLLATDQHALDGPEHTGQLPVDRLSTDELDTAKRLGPDGLGGVTWAEGLDADDFLKRRGGPGHVVSTTTASGSALDLDLSAANWFDITLTDDCTLTFSGTLTSGVGLEWTIILRGEFTVTWPAAGVWKDTDGSPTSTPPVMTGEQNVVVVTTLDGGTSYGLSVEGDGSGSGASTLDDLSDVTITSPQEDDTLRYVGGAWINDDRRFRPVTHDFGSGPELVWDGDDLVMEWF